MFNQRLSWKAADAARKLRQKSQMAITAFQLAPKLSLPTSQWSTSSCCFHRHERLDFKNQNVIVMMNNNWGATDKSVDQLTIITILMHLEEVIMPKLTRTLRKQKTLIMSISIDTRGDTIRFLRNSSECQTGFAIKQCALWRVRGMHSRMMGMTKPCLHQSESWISLLSTNRRARFAAGRFPCVRCLWPVDPVYT